MKYIEGFRNAEAAAFITDRLHELGGKLANRGRRARVMEVCGSHTMAIARFGIRGLLPENVDLISGPGCPVCVTDTGYIDAAIDLARKGALIATFGDMVRVPGSESDLASCRAQGASVEVCYSPMGALDLATKHPDREVVFLAIGFETTAAPIISLVETAIHSGIGNLSLLTAFKLVPPALAALLADPEIEVHAFLCPAHVSAIIGSDAYRPFAEGNGTPCVVAGFEPLDILYGLQGILEQMVKGESRVQNQYDRVVKPEGNRIALKLMETYIEPADATWRGLGVIPKSGLSLRAEFSGFDAAHKHGIEIRKGHTNSKCLCGEVLKGKIAPPGCSLFGKACTPEHPIGPCMVSVEGSCAAHYKYARSA